MRLSFIQPPLIEDGCGQFTVVELSFFGGVDEIGGNKILLQDGKTRTFLDFGLSFGLQQTYYDEYLQARPFGTIDEYLAFGLLPRIKGLYREDHLKHTSPKHELLDSKKAAEAVLISHAHMDHVGLIPYLRPDIQLVGSGTTHNILSYLQDTTNGDAGDFCDWHPSFRLISMKRGGGMKRATSADLEAEKKTREYVTLQKGQPHELGDIEVVMYPVDHSLPGSDAYVITTSSGSIAYTGDLRFHGYNSGTTREFAKALEGADVKVLLCEGTRASDKPGFTEESLENELTRVFGDTKKLVLVNYSARDTGRLLSLSRAATACGRRLLINPNQDYYLKVLRDGGEKSLPAENDVDILLPRKGWGVWGNSDYDEKNQKEDYTASYPKAVREHMFQQSALVTPDDVADAQTDYVVTCSFYELNLLHDLKPKEGSCFIWSQSEPYDEETVIDFNRVKNWLTHFGLGAPRLLHCSGHMCGQEIEQLIKSTNPEIVVPIHTLEPDFFKKWHKDVRVIQRNGALRI